MLCPRLSIARSTTWLAMSLGALSAPVVHADIFHHSTEFIFQLPNQARLHATLPPVDAAVAVGVPTPLLRTYTYAQPLWFAGVLEDFSPIQVRLASSSANAEMFPDGRVQCTFFWTARVRWSMDTNLVFETSTPFAMSSGDTHFPEIAPVLFILDHDVPLVNPEHPELSLFLVAGSSITIGPVPSPGPLALVVTAAALIAVPRRRRYSGADAHPDRHPGA